MVEQAWGICTADTYAARDLADKGNAWSIQQTLLDVRISPVMISNSLSGTFSNSGKLE